MSVLATLRLWLYRGGRRFETEVSTDRSISPLHDPVVRAYGDSLSLLATIPERKNVILLAELSRSLAEFAMTTAGNRQSRDAFSSFGLPTSKTR